VTSKKGRDRGKTRSHPVAERPGGAGKSKTVGVSGEKPRRKGGREKTHSCPLIDLGRRPPSELEEKETRAKWGPVMGRGKTQRVKGGGGEVGGESKSQRDRLWTTE